ncbi:DC1 [Dillenia turbinata]|uniref:DC1 n=1 Tax=Dillenia turbinata TaxID=194707 RepID=A0AAN8VND7_9MAGN
MAPLNKVQAPSSQHLLHPMHPKHPLLQIYSSKEFECDGCKALGSGTRYRCDPCCFDLHTLCATCPSTLSSHLHPNHSLTLVNISNSKHRCDLCRDEVDGLFYTCRACDFDVHPLCTELPAHVQHVTHPHHVLKLEEHAIPGWCLVCRHTCRSWRYRCGTCGVDIHLECLLVSPETTTKSIHGATISTTVGVNHQLHHIHMVIITVTVMVMVMVTVMVIL